MSGWMHGQSGSSSRDRYSRVVPVKPLESGVPDQKGPYNREFFRKFLIEAVTIRIRVLALQQPGCKSAFSEQLFPNRRQNNLHVTERIDE